MFYNSIVFFIVTILLIYFVSFYKKYFILWWKIGGPCPLPLTAPLDMTRVDKIFYAVKQFTNDTGKNWYGFSWMGIYPVIYTADPDMVQRILTSQKCLNKSLLYKVLSDSFGLGLLSSNNPEWHKSRKLINPVFTQKILKSFIPVFNKEVDIFIKILDQYADKEGDGDYLFPLIAKCTFDIAHITTMGVKLNVQTSQHSDEWEAFIHLMHISMERAIKFWQLNAFIFSLSNTWKSFNENKRKVHNWIQKLIDDKIKKEKEDEMNCNDKIPNYNYNDSDDEDNISMTKSKNIFIDHAHELVKKNEFTWEDFENQSKNILVGAFETTATTVHSIMLILAMFPDHQEKVFEEIHNLFPEKEFQVNYEEIQQMQYLDMIINETLRLLPTIPILAREASEDFEIKNDTYVPAGTQLIIDLFNLHRNPLYWGKNANKFNPENFTLDNIKKQHPYAYVPFLKGQRNCLGFKYAGLSLKVIMAKIIRNYRFTTDSRFDDLHCFTAVSLKFKTNPKICVHRREK